MAAVTNRLAQVFLWKRGDAPNLEYAIELLEAANPDAAKAIAADASLLQLFAVSEPWPDDPWERAVEAMDATPAPTGRRWTDPASYDLAGWQGKNVRTGDDLFVVSAYSRTALQTPSGTSQNAEMTPTIRPPVAQTPYYPQYPTGPIAWPPRTPHEEDATADSAPLLEGAAYFPSRYSPLNTGPTGGTGTPNNITEPLANAIRAALLDSYAPFYVGFGPRLVAALIDLFFTMVFPVVALVALSLKGLAQDIPIPFGQYALVACLAIVVFVAYHVVQLGLWGQTLGKALMAVRVVAPDGGVPGFGLAFLRVLGYFFSLLPAGWGFVRMATDPKRQALHDRIAETFVIPEKIVIPIPAGLPGYSRSAHAGAQTMSAMGMAAIGARQDFASGQLATVPQLQEIGLYDDTLTPMPSWADAEAITIPPAAFPGLDTHSVRVEPEKKPSVEKARALFKSGLTELEKGHTPAVRGYKVDHQLARVAASLLKDALDIVPNSVSYRYFYAVALRYAEGMEPALHEFRRVLELDPEHYEVQQQVTYGARWHDAFAYPSWISPAPVEIDMALPEAVATLLPEGGAPVTRMVLLREGGNKRTAFLSRTPLSAWSTPPSLDMQASLHMTLSSTPHGPILAIYVIMEDGIHQPYVGETFLNPRETAQNAEDACQLGQHMLEQLARQDRTYFIFSDEQNRLLLSRKVTFNTSVQISITRCLYEVQSLPMQTMEPDQFVQAAQWHMEHNSLEQVKEQFLSGEP